MNSSPQEEEFCWELRDFSLALNCLWQDTDSLRLATLKESLSSSKETKPPPLCVVRFEASQARKKGGHQVSKMIEMERKDKILDWVLHLNGLLACFVVYWSLAIMKSVWLAVVLYEAVCLIGVPYLTIRLRSTASQRSIMSRLRPLLLSVFRPSESPSCLLVTTGSLCLFGCGGFLIFLMVQTEFIEHGITEAIAKRSAQTGIRAGSIAQDIGLIFLGVWFCTMNPLLEEAFWRGYLYTEIGRHCQQFKSPVLASSRSQVEDQEARRRLAARRPRALLQSEEQTTLSRWLLSFYFGSFHGIVVFIFVNIYAAILTVIFLAIVSRLWIFLGERQPFGFPFIVAFHAGADLAIVLVVSACDFHWSTPHLAYIASTLVSLIFAATGLFLLYLAWRDHPDSTCLKFLHVPSTSGGRSLLAATMTTSPPQQQLTADTSSFGSTSSNGTSQVPLLNSYSPTTIASVSTAREDHDSSLPQTTLSSSLSGPAAQQLSVVNSSPPSSQPPSSELLMKPRTSDFI